MVPSQKDGKESTQNLELCMHWISLLCLHASPADCGYNARSMPLPPLCKLAVPAETGKWFSIEKSLKSGSEKIPPLPRGHVTYEKWLPAVVVYSVSCRSTYRALHF